MKVNLFFVQFGLWPSGEMTQPITKVLVTGARVLLESDVCMSEQFDLFVEEGKQYRLIHGNAKGADSIAANEAKKRGFEIASYPADWDKHRKSAGHIRNAEMVNLMPDVVIGFIKGPSVGTRACLALVAKKKSAKIIYLWDDGVTHMLTPSELSDYLARQDAN